MFGNALLKEFSRRAVLTYARTRQPEAYLGALLFPEKTVPELDFEYWLNANLLPVMASITVDGTEAQIASRDGGSQVKGEIPAIKRKVSLDENGLLRIRRAGAGDHDLVRNTLYNDIDNMLASVRARIEKMRMDALAYGTMTLDENGVKASVDFGVPSGLQETLAGANTAGGYWTYASSEPITKIQEWVNDVIDSCGLTPTRAITSNTIAALILQNASVRKLIRGSNDTTGAVTLPELNARLQAMGLPQIATYDKKVRVQAANGTYSTVRLFPETRFVMLCDGPLGETLYGPTAEALMSHEITATEAPGLFATVDVETEPPAIWTKAVARSFPTFPAVNSIFQAVVKAE